MDTQKRFAFNPLTWSHNKHQKKNQKFFLLIHLTKKVCLTFLFKHRKCRRQTTLETCILQCSFQTQFNPIKNILIEHIFKVIRSLVVKRLNQVLLQPCLSTYLANCTAGWNFFKNLLSRTLDNSKLKLKFLSGCMAEILTPKTPGILYMCS